MNLPEEMSLPEKVFELLGVETEEEVKKEGMASLVYKIDKDFNILHSHSFNKPRIWTKSSYTIGDIINGAFKIIKLPRYTEADVHLAKGYLANGYTYVARDEETNSNFVYTGKPTRGNITWNSGKYSYLSLPESAFKSVSWDDPEPLSLQSVIDEMEETKCSG